MFNRFGDPERSRLRPGNVHRADSRRVVLQPVVERYRERDLRRFFRGDAAFAAPEIHEFPETEGGRYTIRLKADAILQQSIACLPTRPVGRSPDHMIRTHAGFSHQAGSWDKKRRVVARVERHPGEFVSRVGFIVTRLSRPAKHVVAFCDRRGTAGQHIKEGRNAIVRTRLSCRRFRNNAVRLRLHALACNPGNFSGSAPESSHTAGTSRSSPVGPVGRGRGAKGPVRRDPAADRRTSAAAGAGVTRLVVMQSGKNHGRGVSRWTSKSSIPARYTPASPFSMSIDPHDDGPELQMSARGGNIGSTMAVIP